MTKVIMIFLDAFSSKYLTASNTPFLHGIAQKGYYAHLKPMFAFQGIGAAIFSGTSVNTNKIWCDWVINKEKSGKASKYFTYLLKFSDLIPNDRISKDFRYVYYKIFNQDFGTPNLVPSNLLPRFEVKMKKKYSEKNSLGNISTIFDQLNKYNIKYYTIGVDEFHSDEHLTDLFLQNCDESFGMSLIKLSSLDSLGHKCGPNSQIIEKELQKIDSYVEKIIESFQRSDDSTRFVIFSDHGMSSVSNQFNLLELLDKLPVKIEDDYLVFLDSTVARFWFNLPCAKKVIYDALLDLDCGNVLDDADLKELGIDKIGDESGELFFALKEGWVFYPDFFRRHNSPKGMHGYAYSNDNPILIIHSKNENISFKESDEVQMIDIMPTVLELLNVPIPNTCEGISCILK